MHVERSAEGRGMATGGCGGAGAKGKEGQGWCQYLLFRTVRSVGRSRRLKRGGRVSLRWRAVRQFLASREPCRTVSGANARSSSTSSLLCTYRTCRI